MLPLLLLAAFPFVTFSAAIPVVNNSTLSTITVTTESKILTENASTATTGAPVSNCQIDSSTYQHREQIPRPDPCELCVCVDSEMYCLWRLCPPAAVVAASTVSTTPSTSSKTTNNNSQVEMEFTQLITQQREFNAIKEKEKGIQTTTIPTSVDPKSCYVMGVRYHLGEILPRDTGTCLECSCAEGARVTCTPKDCASQPDLDYLQHSNSLDMFDLDTF